MERLKLLRISNGFTQAAIAERLHVRQNTYSQYENGVREIPIELLKKLAVAYETSIDYIVGLTDEEEPYPKAK